MASKYRISLGEQHHCGEIASIYAPYVHESVVSFEEIAPDAAEIWKRMQKVFEKHVWLVCVYDDQVAGFAYAGSHRERKAYQWVAEVSVYVHPDHRKSGVATTLYEALHEILRKQGYALTYAIMTLPNPASKGFHESFGYKHFAVYEHSGFKFGKWHSTGWWKRPLSDLSRTPNPLITVAELDQEWLEQTFTHALAGLKGNQL